MHILCTICSDIVNQAESLYVTKCGHLFHHHCLSQWIERSRTCPQCRNKVTGACMWRVFPTAAAAAGADDAATLQARLDDAQLAAREHLAQRRDADAAATRAAERLAELQEQLKASEKRLVRSESAASILREQLEAARAASKDAARLRDTSAALQDKLDTLLALQRVVEASAEEVEELLAGYSDARTIAVFAAAFKRAVGTAERARRSAESRLAAARADLAVARARANELLADNCKLKELAATEPRPRRDSKRKSSDSDGSLSLSVSAPHKVTRLEPGAGAGSDDSTSTTTAAANDVSLGTLVARIEAADSPYLSLQRAPPALALQPKLEARAQQASGRENKPAFANKPPTNNKFSIFQWTAPRSAREMFAARATHAADLSYDGLGGHSRADHFPTPRPTASDKHSYAPKLSAKHKLSRKPTTQDIGAIIRRINANKRSL